MKKKFFMPLCLLVAMASCNKSVLEDGSITSGINEVATNNVTLPGGEVVLLPPPPTGKVWENKFVDGFTNLDKWNKLSKGPSWGSSEHHPNLKRWYQKPEMASVNNGNLVLSAKKIGSDQLDCASVSTEGKFDYLYGYCVAKMKLHNPLEIGAQSSFWLMYNDPRDAGKIDKVGGNDGAEVDIFESSWTGDKMGSGLHIDWFTSPYVHDNVPFDTFPNIRRWIAPGSFTGYHQYGLLWYSHKLEVYFDGEIKTRLTDKSHIPWVKEYLKLSTGAAWGNANANFGNIATNTQKSTLVDWVRVYQYVTP